MFDITLAKEALCRERGLDFTKCMGMWLSNLEGGGSTHALHPHRAQGWSAHTQTAVVSIGIVLIAYVMVVVWVVGRQFKKLDVGQDGEDEEEDPLVLVADQHGNTDVLPIREVEEESGAVLL